MINKILGLILEIISKNLSPQLRKILVEGVIKLGEEAKKTKSPWDDIFVKILKILLKINGNTAEE